MKRSLTFLVRFVICYFILAMAAVGTYADEHEDREVRRLRDHELERIEHELAEIEELLEEAREDDNERRVHELMRARKEFVDQLEELEGMFYLPAYYEYFYDTHFIIVLNNFSISIEKALKTTMLKCSHFLVILRRAYTD